MKRRLWAFFLLCVWAALAQAAALTAEQARTLPTAEVEADLADSHPAFFYVYAQRLFAQGLRDEAVTWFYVGQLRFRFRLAALPSLPPDGEPALMASLNATVGRALNEWAGGSPAGWAAAIDRALAWDAAHPNAVTPQTEHPQAWQETRSGLAGLRDSILTNAQDIRAQRAQRGLDNR